MRRRLNLTNSTRLASKTGRSEIEAGARMKNPEIEEMDNENTPQVSVSEINVDRHEMEAGLGYCFSKPPLPSWFHEMLQR